jgi:hypothetical protein
MAIITRISVTVGGKINLGDYQNADRSVTVEADLQAGETEMDAYRVVSETAREMLASEVRQLVENQLDAADLLGADEDTIRRRVRYAKGFSYLKSVDPEEADMLITDMVSELAAKAEPEYDADAAEKEHLLISEYGSDDDRYDPDEDDDEDDFDDDLDEDDDDIETEAILKATVADYKAFTEKHDLPQPLPDDEAKDLPLAEVEAYPDSTDTPNAGLN